MQEAEWPGLGGVTHSGPRLGPLLLCRGLDLRLEVDAGHSATAMEVWMTAKSASGAWRTREETDVAGYAIEFHAETDFPESEIHFCSDTLRGLTLDAHVNDIAVAVDREV